MVGGRVRSETSELVPVGIRGSRDLVKWDSAYLVPLCQRGIQDTQRVLTSLQVAHRPVVPGNRLTLSIIKPQGQRGQERLDGDHAPQLGRGRADGPQQGGLGGALGHGERRHLRDHEDRQVDGDQGEDQI